ncbi:YwmB family TATA-box binding protein [Anaeromicropila herbilytica]|uniref:TATA-box binding n=1 Tax=Anaeromicropila herbilytica TaxID=2785025 RepID=A0A7R7IG83_9FIRM|nr:YwmB family TATA-box binding protein [Anaeromicropila herbilytica]BCN32813.1 hypothetical protein bsdtb5_41080 [Anaeromicropila herbilytica]
MKKIKMIIYIIGVLWISVFAQLMVNTLYKNNNRIVDAFAGTNSQIAQSEIKVIADYGSKYLSRQDKEDLINYIASSIQLKTDNSYKTQDTDTANEISIEKLSKNADTKIKLLSLKGETEHYIVIDLNVYDNMKSVMSYKKILEGKLNELKVKDYQTTILFHGYYNGKLTNDEKNQITDELIDNLDAKIVTQNRGSDVYTVYAYTGLIDEYITVAKSKVNVNIAISYNEQNDQTELYLATPVINSDY